MRQVLHNSRQPVHPQQPADVDLVELAGKSGYGQPLPILSKVLDLDSVRVIQLRQFSYSYKRSNSYANQ